MSNEPGPITRRVLTQLSVDRTNRLENALRKIGNIAYNMSVAPDSWVGAPTPTEQFARIRKLADEALDQ